MVQLALAWVLRQRNVASAIVGASRPEQVHANASASGVDAQRGHARGDRRGARRRRRALTTPPSPTPRRAQAALTAEMSSRILTLSPTTTLPDPSAMLNFMS